MSGEGPKGERNGKFETFWMVWTKPVEGTGSMKPVRKTFDTAQQAHRACFQMSRRFPNKKFFVLEAVSRYQHTPSESDGA